MNNIKPIETAYNNYLFRSRLEARWAVFFDALGIRYEYEAEGYDLQPLPEIETYLGDMTTDKKFGALWYLPDFYLPNLDIFVEIKGQEPTYKDIAKIDRLGYWSKKKVALFGNIPRVTVGGIEYQDDYSGTIHCMYWDCCYYFCECPTCGKIGFQFEGRADRLSCKCEKHGDRGHNTNSPRLIVAYQKASMARF